MEEGRYTIQKNSIIFKGEKLFTTKDLIEMYVIISKGIVVLTNSAISKERQNIYCFNFSGSLIWQIPLADDLHIDNYYVSIYLSPDKVLQAYSKNGVEYTIDEDYGIFLKKELIK